MTRAGAPRRQWWVALAVVWVVSAAYVLPRMDRGWVPHDEGMIGQTAERVLQGELPHRDFGEVYTGGLTYLNAAAARLLGLDLLAPRVVLFLAFLVWIPALYLIATRFARPVVAGFVVALAVAWSLPNYTAALPSWYNLFLATGGTAALLRYLDTNRARWLFVAGLCAGLSILVKVVGLYFVAAALLFLVYRERQVTRTVAQAAGATGSGQAYRRVMAVGLVLVVALLVWLIHRRLAFGELMHFVVPGAALAVFLVLEERDDPVEVDARRRFATLARLVAPFAAGVALPLVAYLVPYLRAGAVGDLAYGMFVAPLTRMQFAALRAPRPETLLPVPILVGLLGLVPGWSARLRGWRVGLIAFLLFAAVALANNAPLYRNVWHSMRWLIPVLLVAGVWHLRRAGRRLPEPRRQDLVLLLAVAAMCSLVQYPFPAHVYWFYVAPLGVLTGLALVASLDHRPVTGPALLVGFYLLFAIARIHPGFIYDMGVSWHRDTQTERLALDRGGILVKPEHNTDFTRLVALTRAHARGAYLYAAPDCPEVYFLSGLRNPTRTIFEFLEDTTARVERTLRVLDARGVTAVVINTKPDFSGQLPAALLEALAERYPGQDSVGRFLVRWKP